MIRLAAVFIILALIGLTIGIALSGPLVLWWRR